MNANATIGFEASPLEPAAHEPNTRDGPLPGWSMRRMVCPSNSSLAGHKAFCNGRVDLRLASIMVNSFSELGVERRRTYRAEMQVAGAALVGGLGGGIASAAGSAAGAGLASISAGKLNALSDSIANSSPTANADIDRTLGNIVANVIATGTGAAVGGGDAGAFAGYNVDRFNRQLHPEKKVMKDLSNGDKDKEHCLEAAGCALVHCAAESKP